LPGGLGLEQLEPRQLLSTINVSGAIAANTVWHSGDIVRLVGDVTVNSGVTLTIEPGAIVKFNAFAGIDLYVNGTLAADASGGQAIVFTSSRDDVGGDTNGDGASTAGAGEWNTITVLAGGSATLRNVDVRSGGDTSYASPGALVADGGQLTLDDATVAQSEAPGVRIANANPAISDVLFADILSAALSMNLASNPAISAVTFDNNGVNGIALDSGTITGDRFWDDPDVVYKLTGDVTVAGGASLTVAPGQVVKAASFAGIDLIVNGELNVQGAELSPVVFTSDNDDSAGGDTDHNGPAGNFAGARGAWNGIHIAATGDAQLDHVQIRYGGDSSYASLGAISVTGGSLSLNHAIIRDAETPGLRISDANPVVANTQFTNISVAALSMNLASNPAISAVSFTNNGVNGIALDGGTITGNRFWNDPDIVYKLTGDVTVDAGASLTIAPGQVIKSASFSGIDLYVNGTLSADGTEADPIVFTSDNDDTAGGDTDNNGIDGNFARSRGSWNALHFNAGSAGTLDHVDVRYGGDFSYAAPAALFINGGNVSLTQSVFQHGEAPAVRIVNANPTIAGVSFEHHSSPALTMNLASNPAISDVSFDDNVVNGVALDGGTITGNRFWNDPDIVYKLTGDVTVDAGASLTIAPGQVIKSASFSGIDLYVNGTLSADGTEADPIVFTSDNDDTAGGDTDNNGIDGNFARSRGSWNALHFNAGSVGTLDHVDVRYGGDFSYAAPAALYVNGGNVSLTQSVFQHGEAPAVRIVDANPTIAGVSFEHHSSPALTMNLASNPAISAVSFDDNLVNGIALDGGTITGNRFWDDPDVVYKLTGDVSVDAGASLTIAPGQVIKSASFSGIDLYVNGTLSADGTEADPIVFTSDNDDTAGGDTDNNGPAGNGAGSRGSWNALHFNAGSAGTLDHVDVRYGGDFSYGSPASLYVNGGNVSLTNSLVRDSEAPGLRIAGANPTVAGVSFQHINQAGMSMDLVAQPDISDVSFLDCGINGVALDSGSISGVRAWDDPDVVYWLVGDVTVPAEAMLIVQAGQVIKARSFAGVDIEVFGLLTATALPDDPIVFTSDNDDTVGGDTDNNGPAGNGAGSRGSWSSIRVHDGGQALLQYIELRYGGDISYGNRGAVIVDGGELSMLGSFIRDSETSGVLVQNGGSAGLANSLLARHGDAGVRLESGGDATATNLTIDGNTRGVIVDGAGSSVTLTNTLVTFNSAVGVGVSSGGLANLAYSDVFSTTGVAFQGLADPTGQTGNLGVDPAYLNRGLMLYSLRSGSPVIDAGASDGVLPYDMLGRPRFDDPGIDDIGAGPSTFYDMGALERQEGSDPVNLAISDVAASVAQLGIGDPVTLSWTVTNNSALDLTGTWMDAVFLSRDAVWDIDDLSVGSVVHTGGLTVGSQYDAELTLNMPAATHGPLYLLVRSDARQQVREVDESDNQGQAQVTLDVPALPVNAPGVAGSFAGGATRQYFRVEPQAGRTMTLDLDSVAASGRTRVLVALDRVPGDGDFDFQSGSNTPDASVTVPLTRSGTYYVMVESLSASTQTGFTLAATLPGFSVRQVSPAVAGNVGQVTLEILGADLTDLTQVTLEGPATLTPIAVTVPTPDRLYATFDLTGAATGQYDVHVRSQQELFEVNEQTSTIEQTVLVHGDVTVADGLEVVAGGGADLRVQLLTPASARLGRPFAFELVISNAGNSDLPVPVLLVSSPDGTPLSLSENLAAGDGSVEQVVALGRGMPQVLRPGETVRVPVFSIASHFPNAQIQVFNLSTLSGNLDLQSLEATYDDGSPQFDETWTRFTGIIGGTWTSLHTAMREMAATLSGVGHQSVFSGHDLIQSLLGLARAGADSLDDVRTLRDPATIPPVSSIQGASAAAMQTFDVTPADANSSDLTLGAALVWVQTVLFPYLNHNYGPETLALWQQFVTELPATGRVTINDPNSQIIGGYQDTRGFRDSRVTQSVNRSVTTEARNEILRRIKAGQMQQSDLPANTQVTFNVTDLIDAGRLDSASGVGAATNFASDLDYVRPEEIPGNLAGGIGGSDVFGDDRRRITGQIKVFRLVDTEGNTIFIDVESDLTFQVDDTIDFSPGDLGSLLEQFGTRPLRLLEDNGVANDLPFTVTFKPVADDIFINPSALPRDWQKRQPEPEPPAQEPQPPVAQAQTTVIRSSDPNDITGPAGAGPNRALFPPAILPYTIRFENDPEQATAPALDVFVTTTLDADIDLDTFELGSLGFGSILVPVPAGLQAYTTHVDTTNPDGSPLRVIVTASLDIATRAVNWSFISTDPETGLTPADPAAGFLPPNDDEGSGEGFLTYTAAHLPSAASGTSISAVASIVFDTNDAIITNTWTNQLDTEAPVSSVAALPASVSTPTFAVNWSGSDAVAGVASYDVFVSVDGGGYTLWLDDTTDTSASYPGVNGSSYAFYTRATDQLGLTEAAPAQADAMTTVSAGQAVDFGVGAAKALIFTDSDGTLVTVSLVGGTGQALFTGSNIVATPGKKGTVITGSDLSLASLDVLSSGAAGLKFKTSGGDGRLELGDLTVQGALNGISGKTVDVIGDVLVSGAAAKVDLGSLAAGGQSFVVQGAAGKLNLGSVRDLDLRSTGVISSLAVSQWLTSGADDVSRIEAPSAGKIASAGAFEADLTLTDASAASSLASLKVTGAMTGSVLRSAAGVGSITADRFEGVSVLVGVEGEAQTLPTDAAAFTNRSAVLGSLIAKSKVAAGYVDSVAAAWSIGKASLGLVQIDSDSVFGLSGHMIKSLAASVADPGGAVRKLVLPKIPTSLPVVIDEEDFHVQLVS
jgi:hypothetical protein